MSFFATFERMVVILFAIALGYMAKRLQFLSEDTDRKLTKLILNVTQPCMILAAVMVGDALPELSSILSVLKVTAIFYAVGFLGLLVIPCLVGGPPEQRSVWRFSALFSNMGFMGYPVVEALFGTGAVFYAVILNIPFNILSFSVGPLIVGSSRRFDWKVLCTPTMITSVLGLLIALAGVQTPALLGNMMDFVGDVTVPLALLMLGSTLAGMPAKSVIAMPRLWVLSAIRLLLLPTVLWLILRPMQLDPVVQGVAVIIMAMPVAVVGVMLCMEYDGDVQCMAQAIFLSTMLSMVTIPVVAMLML